MSHDELKEAIEIFFAHFAAQHRFLSELPTLVDANCLLQRYGTNPVPNVVMLQACVHLDALARVTARGRGGTPRERFVSVLTEHSGVRTWGLVSLPELWGAIQHPGTVDSRRLRQQLEEIRTREEWSSPGPRLKEILLPREVAEMSRIVPADRIDRPVSQTLTALAGAGVCVDDICKAVVQEFTHAGILYRDYRCALVHEARPKSRGWHFSPRQAPHYCACEDDEILVCLVIPNQFVLKTLACLITILREDCRRRSLNPFEFFP